MHSLLPVCWLALSGMLACPAASPERQLQEHVTSGYKAVDEFSVVYLMVVNEVDPGGTICMGPIAYRYNRAQKKLAIGGDGDPLLLVEGNTAFIWLWKNEDETSTYLEFKKSRAIDWRDIDEAIQLIKKQYPLAGPTFCLPGPVLPFLDGGVEQIFSKKTRVVTRDDDSDDFFVAGHPQRTVLIGIQDKSKLDPKKYPRCIKTENAVSTWQYAIHHETGLISVAMGVVPRMQVLGVPGNKVDIGLIRAGTYHAGGERSREFPEVSLRLPQTARTIVMDELKSALHKEMMRGGLKKLIDKYAEVDKELQAIIESENNLTKKVVEQKANAARNPKEFKNLQLELKTTQGTKKTYTYVEAAMHHLIEEVREKQKKINEN